MVTVRICSKLKTSWKSVVFTNKVGKNSPYFVGVLIKQLFHSAALVGYEMIIANVQSWNIIVLLRLMLDYDNDDSCQVRIQGRWNGWIFTPLFLSPSSIMLMHRPQTSQPGFGSITLLQKFTPHFKILDPHLDVHYIQHTSGHWHQNKRCTAPCFNHVCQHGWLIKEAGVGKEVFKKVTLIKHEYINHLKINLRDSWW